MKDIKHIRRDFHFAAWVMPVGWDMGVPWGLGESKDISEIQSWCVSYLREWHMQRHNFWGPRSPGALGRVQKVKYH